MVRSVGGADQFVFLVSHKIQIEQNYKYKIIIKVQSCCRWKKAKDAHPKNCQMFCDCQKDEVLILSNCVRRKQLPGHPLSERNFSSPCFDGELESRICRAPSKLLRGYSEDEHLQETKHSSPSCGKRYSLGSIWCSTWRKEKTPSASPSCTIHATYQARTLSVDEIKQRWRCQQIANQQQLTKAQRSSWLGWLLHPRSRSLCQQKQSK